MSLALQRDTALDATRLEGRADDTPNDTPDSNCLKAYMAGGIFGYARLLETPC